MDPSSILLLILIDGEPEVGIRTFLVCCWQFGIFVFLSFFFLSCKLNSYLRHTSTFFLFWKMQTFHLVQHQSHRVLFLYKSTQLRVYIKYKNHTFDRVTTILFSSLLCCCWGVRFFLFSRKTLWPFFWGERLLVQFKEDLTGSQINWLPVK